MTAKHKTKHEPVAGAKVEDDTRMKIIRAAGRAFARGGYQISLDEIAKEAGVGRRTLYNQFKNKDELFGESIHHLTNETISPVFAEAAGKDLRTHLINFVTKYVEVILKPDYVQCYRLFVSELYKHEHLGEVIYDMGFGRVQTHLAHILRDNISAGNLTEFDADLAAIRVLSSAVGSSRHRALLGLPLEPKAQRNKMISAVVDELLCANKA